MSPCQSLTDLHSTYSEKMKLSSDQSLHKMGSPLRSSRQVLAKYNNERLVQHNNLFLTCATKHNSNIALLLMYLYRLVMVLSLYVGSACTFFVQVFKDYFGELEEESIRDNFVVIYELMDETMDFGYPQAMDSKILREYALCHEKNAQLLIILSQVYYSRKQPTRECTKATRRCYKCRFMA